MAGMSNPLIDKVLNATTPTGTGGNPGTWTAYAASPMKVKLTSSASSDVSSGAEISGAGYTAGGQAVSAASTPASSGSAVALPAGTALSWTNGGTTWSIVGFELTDSAGVRTWFGSFNGQPISVANGNTFQIAVGGITIDLS